MQNFYADEYELLTLTNDASSGNNSKTLNDQLEQLNDDYASTRISERDANLLDNYNFHKNNPNIDAIFLGQKTYAALEKGLSLHLDMLFSYKSEVKLFSDVNNCYMTHYQICTDTHCTIDNWFLSCAETAERTRTASTSG
jgi:hypothetical protein